MSKSDDHRKFLMFIEERRSQASSPVTKSAYTIVKKQYIEIHKPTLTVVDMDFRALVDMDNGRIKKGQVFPCYGGMVYGCGREYPFKDTKLFEAINIKYHIDDE